MSLTEQKEALELVHAHHTFTTILETLDRGSCYTLTPSDAGKLRTVLGAIRPPLHLTREPIPHTRPHSGDLSEP